MKKTTQTFRGKIWLYPGESANWHFVNVPKKASGDIEKLHGESARGWGSIPIEATVGKTTWNTSIFPDKKSGMYMLPLKAAVRKREFIGVDDVVLVKLRFR